MARNATFVVIEMFLAVDGSTFVATVPATLPVRTASQGGSSAIWRFPVRD
jgi:hypothetical protein